MAGVFSVAGLEHSAELGTYCLKHEVPQPQSFASQQESVISVDISVVISLSSFSLNVLDSFIRDSPKLGKKKKEKKNQMPIDRRREKLLCRFCLVENYLAVRGKTNGSYARMILAGKRN